MALLMNKLPKHFGVISKTEKIWTQAEIIADLKVVATGTSEKCLEEFLRNLIFWRWSEFDGKYEGCRIWSRKALFQKRKKATHIHEHAVPRKFLADLFLKHFRKKDCKVFLNKFCRGVVVTNKEDKRLNKMGFRSQMPDVWDLGSGQWFDRFRLAKIPLVEVDWQQRSWKSIKF